MISEAAGAIEGITDDMDAMQQFNAQVEKCTDCTTRCLKGLANVKVKLCFDYI